MRPGHYRVRVPRKRGESWTGLGNVAIIATRLQCQFMHGMIQHIWAANGMQGKPYIGLCCYMILWPLSLHSIAVISLYLSTVLAVGPQTQHHIQWFILSKAFGLNSRDRLDPFQSYHLGYWLIRDIPIFPAQSVLDLVAAEVRSFLRYFRPLVLPAS